jgi:hypothetical protein
MVKQGGHFGTVFKMFFENPKILFREGCESWESTSFGALRVNAR